MKGEVSIVYAIRDRPVSRLINSVNSIRISSSGYKIHFIAVDYGSNSINRDLIKRACIKHKIRLIRTETEGHIWSRSIAMNIGIKSIKTDIFISTDIDMLYNSDLIYNILNRLNQNDIIYCRPRWLPPSGNFSKAILGDFKQLGGMLAMHFKDFNRLGGFNESINFWGFEDVELNLRAKNMGFVIKWLPESFKMFHVWHPVSYGICDSRPIPSIYNDNYLIANSLLSFDKKLIDLANNNIGKVLNISERPILDILTKEEFKTWKTIHCESFAELATEIIHELIKGNELYFHTGSRIKFLQCRDIRIEKIIKVFNAILKKIGFELKPILNPKHDWVYIILDTLKPIIGDYYWDFDSGCYFYPTEKTKVNLTTQKI